MTDYDLKVLKEFAGEPQDGLSNGPEMKKALAFLKKRGYLEGKSATYISRKGFDYLNGEVDE